MIRHFVKVYPSKIKINKKKQLAWKIAEIASDNARLDNNSIDMVINRIIDNASVAIASLNRPPVISAREMAIAHQRKNGATIFAYAVKDPENYGVAEFDSNYKFLNIEDTFQRIIGGKISGRSFD